MKDILLLERECSAEHLNLHWTIDYKLYLMKEILLLERECSAEHLNLRWTIDYKTRLIQLNPLPLMYVLEFQDILFLIKSLKTSNSSFNIYNYISFNSSHTRSSSCNKLCHKFCQLIHIFIFLQNFSIMEHIVNH